MTIQFTTLSAWLMVLAAVLMAAVAVMALAHPPFARRVGCFAEAWADGVDHFRSQLRRSLDELRKIEGVAKDATADNA